MLILETDHNGNARMYGRSMGIQILDIHSGVDEREHCKLLLERPTEKFKENVNY